jgi:MYXO-CTERM domain-containing protein
MVFFPFGCAAAADGSLLVALAILGLLVRRRVR